MKRFFQTVRNIFSIEDLRIRILNTIGFLIIFRLGSFIALPASSRWHWVTLSVAGSSTC
jgi:preprotein translocase subunit SecY